MAENQRRCDCESETCHPQADCNNRGTVKTLYSRVCAECAAKLPKKYLADEPATRAIGKVA